MERVLEGLLVSVDEEQRKGVEFVGLVKDCVTFYISGQGC